jgi:hypothetical protein
MSTSPLNKDPAHALAKGILAQLNTCVSGVGDSRTVDLAKLLTIVPTLRVHAKIKIADGDGLIKISEGDGIVPEPHLEIYRSNMNENDYMRFMERRIESQKVLHDASLKTFCEGLPRLLLYLNRQMNPAPEAFGILKVDHQNRKSEALYNRLKNHKSLAAGVSAEEFKPLMDQLAASVEAGKATIVNTFKVLRDPSTVNSPIEVEKPVKYREEPMSSERMCVLLARINDREASENVALDSLLDVEGVAINAADEVIVAAIRKHFHPSEMVHRAELERWLTAQAKHNYHIGRSVVHNHVEIASTETIRGFCNAQISILSSELDTLRTMIEVTTLLENSVVGAQAKALQCKVNRQEVERLELEIRAWEILNRGCCVNCNAPVSAPQQVDSCSQPPLTMPSGGPQSYGKRFVTDLHQICKECRVYTDNGARSCVLCDPKLAAPEKLQELKDYAEKIPLWLRGSVL